MKTVQKRIGLILTIFSIVVFMARLIPRIRLGIPFDEIMLNTGTILIMGLIFIPTIKWEHIICKVYQVSMISIVGFLSFIDSYDSSYSFIFITMSIILMFAYGWYNKNFALKAIITIVMIYAFIVVFSLPQHLYRWTVALNLIGLIVVFLFLLWIIAKDYITKIEKDVQVKIDQMEYDLSEYKKRVEKEEVDYELICLESIQTNKALLDLCKKLAKRGGGRG